MNFGVCDFSRFEVTDWRLRRWRLCFLALMTVTQTKNASNLVKVLVYVMNGLYFPLKFKRTKIKL